MKKVLVDKQDDSRVLLSEVLPYETPLFFSNALFYRFHRLLRNKSNPPVPALIAKIVPSRPDGSYRPYDYPILHSEGKTRRLSIMHPVVQAEFVDFYSKNAEVLLYLCSKSAFSLRSPRAVASQYYEKALADLEEGDLRELAPEEEPRPFEPQTRFASSYFSYRAYSYIYKFYDSLELLRLEKRFRFVLKFDLARCFNSIYTHSIAWAIKDKRFAKETINANTIEREFDTLMQSANYRETHGILIGPEASRIFAEIILQRVDINVQSRLHGEGLRFRSDYQVRRYVDDYFVFARTEQITRKVFDCFQEELSQYKLFVNESKTISSRTPMMPPQSIAKTRALRSIEQLFRGFLNADAQSSGAGTHPPAAAAAVPQTVFNTKVRPLLWMTVVQEIEIAEKETSAGYEGLVGFTLAVIRSRCSKVLASADKQRLLREEEIATLFSLSILEVAFFLYAMDMRVRPTYLLAQIVNICCRASEWLSGESKEVVRKKCLDEVVEAIDRIKADEGIAVVEVSILLTLLRSLEVGYDLPSRRLADCMGIRQTDTGASGTQLQFALRDGRIGYFEFCTLMNYVRDDLRYRDLQEFAAEAAVKRIEEDSDAAGSAELTMLFCDLLACPYVHLPLKDRAVEAMARATKTNLNAGDARNVAKFCAEWLHWTDWEGDLNLTNALLKKELRSPYGG